ncbi:MAG: DUF4040 domain-containing protein [Oscillospiraceae bacterium]|nr:DUF4040 domain-containing protein [Oscillospiraceae bacterium]
MEYLQISLFVLLIVCALSTVFTRNLLASVIIFMAYSTIMAIVWILLEAPDLAITEAAVGAGISSLLFFLVLRRIRLIQRKESYEKRK